MLFKSSLSPITQPRESFVHHSSVLFDLATSRPVCFPTSFSGCLVFFPLSLCLAKWIWPDLMNGRHVHTTAVGVSLRWSGCLRVVQYLLVLGTDFFVGNMVFVWDEQYLTVAPHFHGSYSSYQLCCEGPWFTSIQEYGCDKRSHQSYLGTERNAPVVPNGFQSCQCCCRLCYPGEHLRLRTLVIYNWAMVL